MLELLICSKKRKKRLCRDLDAGAEAGPVVDDDEGAALDHHLDAGGPGEPHLYPAHHHLHLCRARHAALWQGLHGRKLCSRPDPKVNNVFTIYINIYLTYIYLCMYL